VTKLENETPPCVVEVFKVVTRLQQNDQRCGISNICNELKSQGLTRKDVLSALDFLEEQGKVEKAADRQYIANETPTDQPAT
jgi:Fe2+ or Zn2+ uptake regulation protein